MKHDPNEPTDQTEFSFSPDFRRPRAVAAATRRSAERGTPPRVPLLAPSPRRRRGVGPARRRLAIAPEAFASPDSPDTPAPPKAPLARSRAGSRFDGLLEAVVAILATMAFGLAWAAYELDFDFGPGDAASPSSLEGEYALVAPTTPFGLAGAAEAEWTTTNAEARGFTPREESSAR